MKKKHMYILLLMIAIIMTGLVAFSQSFDSWDNLGLEILDRFNKAAIPDADINEKAGAIVKTARTDGEKADLIAEFIGREFNTTKDNHDILSKIPQTAVNTFAGKSGNLVDKAVLAKSLFESAGLKANPIFFSKAFEPIDTSAVSLNSFGPALVWVSGTDFEAVYNPVTDRVTTGLGPLYGKTVWMPGYDRIPVQRMPGDKESSLFKVVIDLRYDRNSKMILGSGMITASNCLCPFGQMHGLNNEAFQYLDKLVSNIFAGAELTDYNPTRFDYFNVTAGFKFDLDRTKNNKILIGRPDNGLMAVVDGVQDDMETEKTLYLQCLVDETIEIRIDKNSLEQVDIPDSFEFTNPVGELSLDIGDEDSQMTLNLNSKLLKVVIKPDEVDYLRHYLDNLEKHRLIKIGIKPTNIN